MAGCAVADLTTLDDRLGNTWCLPVLDALVASGTIRDSDLDGLSGVQLASVASEAVAHVLRDWDPHAAIRSVPQPTPRVRRRTAA